jgi:hypothetical protein
MPLEITIPVPYGQEDKFEKALVKLKKDGLRIKRLDKHNDPILISDGKRTLLSDYKTFLYDGEATQDATINLCNAFLNVVGTPVSLNGGRVDIPTPRSRSKIFFLNEEGKAKSLLSSDNQLNRLLSYVSKLGSDVFAPEYRPIPRSKACDKSKFIQGAMNILSRYHARTESHLLGDKTSLAAYCLATNKEPSTHRARAWVDEVKNNAPNTVSVEDMQKKIISTFAGTDLGSELTAALSKEYLIQDEYDLITSAVESCILNSSLKIDNNLIKSFLPDNPDAISFSGVVVKTGVHHPTNESGELYYVKMLTDDNNLVEIVSRTDVRISKHDIIDSTSNGIKLNVTGKLISRTDPLIMSGEVRSPSVARVKMIGYESTRVIEQKMDLTVKSRVKLRGAND